jgi:arginyl-tRNA synthetase
MFEHEQRLVETKIRDFCRQNQLPDPILQWKWIPFTGHWGMSTSFFQLAAQEARQGKSIKVNQRAQEIATALANYLSNLEGFEKIEAVNGYLNLYFSQSTYAQRVVDTVLQEGRAFGRAPARNQLVMVEFSQPNTHKAFHVGHLRNVILGAAISNILEHAGYKVIRANYIGDIGLHVIKWLWNYMTYHAGEEPGEDKTRWMGDLYAEADRRFEEDPEVENQVRALFARWHQRDAEVLALWKKTRQWSLEGFDQIYRLLNVHFDRVYFESEVEEPGIHLVEELIHRGIARDERPDGPVIVPLDELLGTQDKYRTLVVLRSDGTSLYATKDLALAILKFQEYPLDLSIYVVDARQSLYLQQIFKTLELMGYEWAKRCYHLAYEIVNLPGNVTMSSREGTVVLLEDLVKEATRRALEIVQVKNPELPAEKQQAIAHAVALGALKYSMLSRDNTKVVTFDWESALDINGQAAPYIQYAYVRAGSILRKVDFVLPQPLVPTHVLTSQELELVDLISRLPGEVQRAAAEYRPLLIANLVYETARVFNDFYTQCPVLQAEPGVREFRLRLVAATRQALEVGLNLLGISAPEAM